MNLRPLFSPKGTVYISKENYRKSKSDDIILDTLSGCRETCAIGDYKVEELSTAYLIHFKYADDAVSFSQWAVREGYINVRLRV